MVRFLCRQVIPWRSHCSVSVHRFSQCPTGTVHTSLVDGQAFELLSLISFSETSLSFSISTPTESTVLMNPNFWQASPPMIAWLSGIFVSCICQSCPEYEVSVALDISSHLVASECLEHFAWTLWNTLCETTLPLAPVSTESSLCQSFSLELWSCTSLC